MVGSSGIEDDCVEKHLCVGVLLGVWDDVCCSVWCLWSGAACVGGGRLQVVLCENCIVDASIVPMHVCVWVWCVFSFLCFSVFCLVHLCVVV